MADFYDLPLSGKTVLDVGGFDGAAAAAALAAGARYAECVDNGEWAEYGWHRNADDPIRAGVVFIAGDFLEVGDPADIVICSNVLYHMKDPVAGLKRLRELTKGHLLLRTNIVADEDAGEDGFCWYENGSGHGNNTVWNRPSRAGLLRQLEQAGFTVLQETPEVGCIPGAVWTQDDYEVLCA